MRTLELCTTLIRSPAGQVLFAWPAHGYLGVPFVSFCAAATTARLQVGQMHSRLLKRRIFFVVRKYCG